jgi:hypothetical protein
LRGQEGVFGIGTADGKPGPSALFAHQPKPHVQCLGDLRFSWYALRQGDPTYRPLTVEWTLGPDLARQLHPVWPLLEEHAERIDRLFRQQAGMRVEVVSGGLVLTLPLAAGGDAIRVLVRPDGVRYFLDREGELLAVDHQDEYVDRGVYLLLAELAARG